LYPGVPASQSTGLMNLYVKMREGNRQGIISSSHFRWAVMARGYAHEQH
jgi:hypothetical protein